MIREANGLLISLLVLICAIVAAAHEVTTPSLASETGRTVPGTVWYQGFLADVDTGDPINDTVEVVAELFDAAVDGSGLWGPETHSGVAVVEGWFNIELGSIESPLPDFSIPPYYLQLTINGEALDTRMKLASAPTAIRAGDVDGGGGGGIGGGGDAGYIPVFISGNEISNSVIRQTSGRITIDASTSDAKLRVENSGDLPVLKLVNTSTNGGTVPLMSIERSTCVGPEPLLLMKSPATAGNYNLFEIEQVGVPGESLLVWVDGSGRVNTSGGLYVDEPYAIGVHCKSSFAGNESGAIYGECTATEDWDATGVYGDATASDGYGTGGTFWGGETGCEGWGWSTATGGYIVGLWGRATGGTSSTSAGVYAAAYGGGTNYGIYADADYGTEDWAGYFEGNVYVTGTVSSSKAGFPWTT